jgi:hypothetical protein
MFVVPVGTVFALTSVRANLPGAPTGFGLSKSLSSFFSHLKKNQAQQWVLSTSLI